MKTLISILLIAAVAGYNIWVHYYNNDVDKHNQALKDYNNGNYEKSFSAVYELCENKEMAESCNLLAMHYEYGYAVQKDEIKAVRLYQRACDKGDDTACYNLSLCYYEGKGVGENDDKAREILNKLCDKNHDKKSCDLLKEINNDGSTQNSNYDLSKNSSYNSAQSVKQNNNTSQNANLAEIVENLYNTDFGEYQNLFVSGENGIIGANLASDTLLKALKQEFHEPVIMFDVRLCAGISDDTKTNIIEARNSLEVSSYNNTAIATFTQSGKAREVVYTFDCKGNECKIADIKQNNFSLLKTLNEAAAFNRSFEESEANIAKEADDPLENVMKQGDEMDKKLNAYYKQIMKGLEGEKKDKFRNAQRAWIKFATEAQDTKETALQIANARFSILEIQTNFLKAVIDGKTPTINDNQSTKFYKDKINEFFDNIADLPRYRWQSLYQAQEAWQKYANLKKDAATMMGLDGDEIYRQECKFWAEFLSYI